MVGNVRATPQLGAGCLVRRYWQERGVMVSRRSLVLYMVCTCSHLLAALSCIPLVACPSPLHCVATVMDPTPDAPEARPLTPPASSQASLASGKAVATDPTAAPPPPAEPTPQLAPQPAHQPALPPASQSDSSPAEPNIPSNLRDLRNACKLVGVSPNGNRAMLRARFQAHHASVDPARSSDAGRAGPASTDHGVAPPFTKHEFARVFLVMCEPDVAAEVVASKGPLTRQQLDYGTASRDVWGAIAAPTFNDYDKHFRVSIPPSCTAYELNPDLHPHLRDGATLKTKFAEVSHGPHLVTFFLCMLASSDHPVLLEYSLSSHVYVLPLS